MYITRNGLLEPLGQSQVMAYLRGLSSEYRVTLISFEKPEDAANITAMAKARADCEALGIRWLPQRFHYRPKLLAPAWCMIVFVFLCLREVWCGNATLIHARSYIPATVALLVNGLTGTPFIFDMRALWPEELITASRLRRGSLLHKAITAVERMCLKRAAAVISLTDAAVEHLHRKYPAELENQRVYVIPTCADLDRFVPVEENSQGPRVYGCLGTVTSGWFKIDWLAAFFNAAAARDPEARFQIVSRDDDAIIRSAIGNHAGLQERIDILSAAPHAVQDVVRCHSVSVMFFSEGLSKLGSSPTRMGEVLGCGLPVVANPGVGDMARIIKDHRVGVLVSGPGAKEMAGALDELDTLLSDPDLGKRCRKAAETLFSLQGGTAGYKRIYRQICAMNAGTQSPEVIL
ncbi:glycosyltransferase [Hoeflea sp. TYP-13]|uniref:glycosyltransferase n=1 Tax=Hoeflea sp. TYP-13 TaxID=3230023 RepID=UPI0034C6DAF4